MAERRMFRYREVKQALDNVQDTHIKEGNAIETGDIQEIAAKHEREGAELETLEKKVEELKEEKKEDPKPAGKGKAMKFFGRFKSDAEGKKKAEAKEKEHPGSFIQEKEDKKSRKYLYVMKEK
jgi:hypothetical protein